MTEVVVLTGGVGGAKLVLGLSHVTLNCQLTAIVNTGDDFRHLGLHISPDIDTLLYTLSNRANPVQGWGRKDETWSFMKAVEELGGPSWFRLGDGDMAVHVVRTMALASGRTLTSITGEIAKRWSISCRILPMSDHQVRTVVHTDEGRLDFQKYFVARRCAPRVRGIKFVGARIARPTTHVLQAIQRATVVLLAPSNPFLSLDPILALPGMRSALIGCRAPVVAISPLVRGKAVKGPTSKLMRELGVKPGHFGIAHHYRSLIDGLLIHEGDACGVKDVAVAHAPTLMINLADKIGVARAALDFAARLRR